MPFAFEHTYASLPARFYARVAPTPVAAPRTVLVNRELAALLGVDPDALDAELLVGNRLAEKADPIALAYAGHQFGGFTPQLGDGRAILLGEVVGRDGGRRDVQLKGAGPTPFSRGGDGRAAIGPVLREYVVSEAMHALGVPTTRALAAATTGESVYRERALPGAVLTRVASSHVRVGTFEFFSARRDEAALRALTDHALTRHYPDAPRDEPALSLLERVIEAQARLVAGWLRLGFVHGVMNTDNTSISGETIDYGPCAFLDGYHPARAFSSIDEGGRYAFANQPRIALWNLSRLAEALLPVVANSETDAIREVTALLERFPSIFGEHHAAALRAKLGLLRPREDDLLLAQRLFDHMAAGKVDFTRFFRALTDASTTPTDDERLAASFGPAADDGRTWLAAWRARLADDPDEPGRRAEQMRLTNPAFIPRNHQVEAMITAAEQGDLAPCERLLEVLGRPYDDQPEHSDLQTPPGDQQWSYRTFCGT